MIKWCKWRGSLTMTMAIYEGEVPGQWLWSYNVDSEIVGQ